MKYTDYCQELLNTVKNLVITDSNGNTLDTDTGLLTWRNLTSLIQKSKHEIYFIGNGASAAMAAHMSADACKTGKLKSRCFHESSLMTAISNDLSYDRIFSLPLSRFGKKDDMLITISSSGNSPNIIEAIKIAKLLKMTVITLSGKSEKNKSRSLGDLNLYLPHMEYGIIESAHQMVLHYWLDDFVMTLQKKSLKKTPSIQA